MVAINLPILGATTNSLNASVVIVKDGERNMPAVALPGFNALWGVITLTTMTTRNRFLEQTRLRVLTHLMFFLDHYYSEIPHFASLWTVSATGHESHAHSQSNVSISPNFLVYRLSRSASYLPRRRQKLVHPQRIWPAVLSNHPNAPRHVYTYHRWALFAWVSAAEIRCRFSAKDISAKFCTFRTYSR